MEEPNAALMVAGTFGFMMQILADFSGYTDMARGAARMMGFELMENFGIMVPPLPKRCGSVGISPCHPGFTNTSTFHWVETERGRDERRQQPVSLCFWLACGMALHGIS